MKHDFIDFIDKDHVVICGQQIGRPSRIGRMHWMEFWENVIEYLEEPDQKPPIPPSSYRRRAN